MLTKTTIGPAAIWYVLATIIPAIADITPRTIENR